MKIDNTDAEQIERLNSRIAELLAEVASLRDSNKTFADHAIHGVAQRPLDSDVRWAVNVLLEKIAEKFEGWDTHDLWRSDAAATVRSFKHDLTTVTSTVGEAVEKTDGGASTTPARLAPGCCSAISPCAHQRKWPNSICDVCLHATLSSTECSPTTKG